MNTNEEWRAVVGYEGYYEVSDQGRVRSLDRIVGQPGNPPKRLKGKMLSLNSAGRYLTVCLYKNSPTREGRNAYVSVIAAAAFFGPKPEGYDVCHNNGRSHDNRLSNLRYDTKSANQQDKWLHGTAQPMVRKTHCPKGHEYTPANVYYSNAAESYQRRCRTCQRLRGLKGAAKLSQRRREAREAKDRGGDVPLCG